jgi:hypothetical protein
MNYCGFKAFTLALLGSTVIVPAVMAQDSEQVTSVFERTRQDLSASGIRSGGMLFYPEIKAEGEFNSNIFATQDNVTPDVNDFIAIVKPSFRLESDWNNNYFGLNASADVGRYTDSSSEDYEDFNLGASTRLDISRGTNIFADLTYADAHEDRGSADSVGRQSVPTTYSTFKALVGFKRDEGVMSFAVNGSYEDANYNDVALIGGGFLENDDRDRETVRGSVRLGFEMNEDYEAFVKFTTIAVKYADSRLDGGPLRDSDGWDVVGGAAFDISGKSKGEFYVGYVKRDWNSASLVDVGDFKFGASLLWNATGLTSMKVAIDRDVTETTVNSNVGSDNEAFAAGILSTRYSVRLEHELRRNLLLGADVAFTRMDFVGTNRIDNMTNYGLGAKYLMNRTFSLNADYKFDRRATDERGQDYKRHSFIVSLSARW